MGITGFVCEQGFVQILLPVQYASHTEGDSLSFSMTIFYFSHTKSVSLNSSFTMIAI